MLSQVQRFYSGIQSLKPENLMHVGHALSEVDAPG